MSAPDTRAEYVRCAERHRTASGARLKRASVHQRHRDHATGDVAPTLQHQVSALLFLTLLQLSRPGGTVVIRRN